MSDTLIKCSKSRFFFIKQKSGRPFNRTASRFRKKTFAMPSASIVQAMRTITNIRIT